LKNKIVCNHFSTQKNVIFAKTDLIRDESYRLLDSGDGKKLEQFGRYRIVRPSQFSSHYNSRLSDKEWLQYDFKYEITEKKKEGEWLGVDNLENWIVKFNHIRFNLAPHEGGQIGIFPEQKSNWKWLENVVHKFYPNFSDQKPMNILNGFAHTGGSTIACMTQPNVVVRIKTFKVVIVKFPR
jgi:23S rRNA (cytosine1962-C5)-methyltransferase